MSQATRIGVALATTAAAVGLSACAGSTQGGLKGSGSECKATYTEHGSQVKVRVQEDGPATVQAIITDSHGNKHGATKVLPSGARGASFSLSAPPPVSRVEVRIIEKSGTTDCLASS